MHLTPTIVNYVYTVRCCRTPPQCLFDLRLCIAGVAMQFLFYTDMACTIIFTLEALTKIFAWTFVAYIKKIVNMVSTRRKQRQAESADTHMCMLPLTSSEDVTLRQSCDSMQPLLVISCSLQWISHVKPTHTW